MSASAPQELHDEFPHDAKLLQWLKLGNPHFCNLAGRYHALGRALHRIETQTEPCSDVFALRLKKQRLSLLDEIAAILETSERNMVHA